MKRVKPTLIGILFHFKWYIVITGIIILLLLYNRQIILQTDRGNETQYHSNDSIMKPMTIDTYEAMKIIACWQQWLAERGIAAGISEEGFTSHNKSLEVLGCEGTCQTLIMYIDNQEVDVLCFPDTSTAQETFEEVVHICECIDILPGMICYESFGVYGNFMIMLPINESSGKIEPLITGFWDEITSIK
jgi:hypothetical protein